MVGEPLDAVFGFRDRVAVLLQRAVLRGEGKTEIGEPAAIGTGPSGATRIAAALPEQKRLQSVLGLSAQADRLFANAHESRRASSSGVGM